MYAVRHAFIRITLSLTFLDESEAQFSLSPLASGSPNATGTFHFRQGPSYANPDGN